MLVGIDRYAQPEDGEWKTLRGCENDVRLVAEVLQDRFAFRPEDIVTLTSEQATHEAIVRAFHTHLIQKAGEDTKVVFWFSGHGSQVPDKTQKDRAAGDDLDVGKDQTMLAYDSRKGTQNGSFDFADDEIHSLLAALRSRDVVFVSDCCHSGGVSRGGGPLAARGEADGTEPHEADARKAFWPSSVTFRDDDRAEPLRHLVHISACRSNEEAGEIETPSAVHGTLTWFLCQALRELPPTASWREATETVRARIAGRLGSRMQQYVDASGASQRAILGGSGRPVPSGFVVEFVHPGELRIAAGRIHGIGDTTSFDLRDIDDHTLATASVDEVRASTTGLKLVGKIPYGKAIWAVPTGRLDGRAPLSVRLPEDRKDLLTDNAYAVASSRDDVEYRLEQDGGELRLVFGGEAVGRCANEAAAVSALMFREANFRYLWDAVAARGQHRIAVRLRAPTKTQCTLRDGDKELVVRPAKFDARGRGQRIAVTAPALDDAAVDSGGMAVLEVENQSDEDLFVAVLSVQEDRAITLVAGEDRSNCLLRKGATQEILVQVGPSKAWTRDRPMIDRYVVFATPRFADFRPFAQEAPATTRSAGDGVRSLLETLTYGEVTRGNDAPMPWGITHLDLELHAAGAPKSSPATPKGKPKK
ncbi:MAG: caspase family protein [Planctomycetota bacterium]